MGLSVVASFVDPTEAKVAAGALSSAGFHAVVLDQNFSTMDWIAAQALGGIRVGVPEDELGEAAEFLRGIIKDRPAPAEDPHPGGLWRTAAILLGVVVPLLAAVTVRPEATWQAVILVLGGLGVPLGWSVAAAAKSRGRRSQLTAVLSTILLVIGGLAVLIALGALANALLHPDGEF